MINYILIKLLQYKIKELDKKTNGTLSPQKSTLTFNQFVIYDKTVEICRNLIKFLSNQSKINK